MLLWIIMKAKRIVDIKCDYCETIFTVMYKHRDRKFCSHECYSNSRKFDRIVKCKYCGSDFTERSYKQRYCSILCSSKAIGERQRGENNPFYGRQHSEKNKQIISNKSKEYNKKFGNSFKGHRHNEETRKIMSDKFVQRVINNNGKHPSISGYKQGWFYSNKNNKEIAFDSSYEEKYYQILENDIDVKRYYRSSLKLNYILNGITKTYNPDLIVEFINDSKELIEIKPDRRLEEPEIVAKHNAAQQYCNLNNINFRIVTEEQLFTSKDREWGFLRKETKIKHKTSS